MRETTRVHSRMRAVRSSGGLGQIGFFRLSLLSQFTCGPAYSIIAVSSTRNYGTRRVHRDAVSALSVNKTTIKRLGAVYIGALQCMFYGIEDM